MTGFDLVRVTWVDAHNNQGAWMTADELAEFAKDEAYRVTQVGYKVHEDDLCIVLAARLSTPSADYGQSFGMCERIPKKLIDSQTLIQPHADGPSAGDTRPGYLDAKGWHPDEPMSNADSMLHINPFADPEERAAQRARIAAHMGQLGL